MKYVLRKKSTANPAAQVPLFYEQPQPSHHQNSTLQSKTSPWSLHYVPQNQQTLKSYFLTPLTHKHFPIGNIRYSQPNRQLIVIDLPGNFGKFPSKPKNPFLYFTVVVTKTMLTFFTLKEKNLMEICQFKPAARASPH